MKNSKRFLSALLSLVMLFSMIPATGLTALAANTEFTNSQLSVASEKESTLAPGVTQDLYTVYDKNGDQVKMFVTTADMNKDSVKVFAAYKDMDPTNYGMSKLTEQIEAFDAKAAAGDEYYQGTVVAGINSSYYNMITGKPTGTFVMNGIDVTTEAEGNNYGYFAVMKDGSVKIGQPGEYSSDKGNIQEAIGIYRMLIADGEIVSGLDDVTKYPRQTIGITADNKVVLMTADGNQAPKSIGLTLLEQAQVMYDLGCVWAGHLDGGGSTTYVCKPEGSDSIVVTNSPSDGSPRSISNGFIIVSTEAPSYEFDHVVFNVENEYLTPGSSVNVTVSGVSSTGNAAEIPDDVTFVAENGSCVDGVFTVGDEVGTATLTAMYKGEPAGSVTVNVVVPDAITFNNAIMTVPYGKAVTLGMTATYGVKEVVFNEGDVEFTLSDPTIGTIEGFVFTPGEAGEAATTSTLTAKLALDNSVTATATINLGKGSEVVYDFEDGTAQTLVFDEPPGTKYNYVWPETEQEVVTAATGKVHSGSKALAMHVDYSNSLESGYMRTSLYSTETKVFENATSVGAWIYIPDEFVGLWVRWTLKAVTVNEDGSYTWGSSINGNTMDTTAGGTGVVSTFDEPGWHYLHVDTSAYPAVGWQASGAMMQFYISDRDGASYKYYAADNSNIPSSFQLYLDDVTVDYSTAVDDREAPVVSNLTYATVGMPDAAALNNQTITTGDVTFAASVKEYTGKDNYTGIDPSTVKAYIDGVEVKCTYSGGIASVDAELTNGKHVVKFAAADKMGNYGCKYGYITVNAAESESTVKLVPQDADATRIKLGSIYNMNLVATAIEEIQSVEIVIDLDNNSVWQLDHMSLAEGFTATYTVDETDNIATLTITREGTNAETGEATLATLPVRVWTLKTGYTYENGTKAGSAAYTLAQYKSSLKEFWRMSVIAEVDKGILTRTDASVDTFSGERVFCDTEMWANYANMTATADGLAYYNAWDGGHVHSAAAIADKATTCTEAGYTGRTYCEGCTSVVDWGTVVKASGHSYAVADGVLKCTACGTAFSGVYSDGKTYVDGVIIADGWSGETYYKDGVKVTGLQKIDGYYYDFGDEGVCPNKARVDGYYFDKSIDAYRYFTAGALSTGDVVVSYPEVCFFDANGVAISGQVDMLGYTCTFDEKGAFVSSADSSVVDAGFCGTNIKYVLLSSGLLKVDGEGVMKDYTSNGQYPGWVIQNDATAVTSLEIGNGITEIGRFGFYKNAHLRSVTFQENSSLETIGWGAFGHNWRLAGITIPASVKVLEGYAIYECGALKYISFEEGSQLKTIGTCAFEKCIGLETLYIPHTVTSISSDILNKANSGVVLQVAKGSAGHVFALNNKFAYELRDGVVIEIASGKLTDTASWAVSSDGELKITGSGDMPNYANYNAQPWVNLNAQIKKISIGKDITSVGNYAFAYLKNVEEIVFEEGSQLKNIGILAFFNNPIIKEVTLPDTVETIRSFAFGDCFALESVYMPQGITSIHEKAFSNSDKVVLSVSEGTYAHEFAEANKVNYEVRDFVYTPVANGKLSDTVQWARYENGELWITGSGAMPNFANQKGQPWYTTNHLIKKVVIGKDITAIGNYAFSYNQQITEVIFEEGSQLQSIGVLSFFNTPKLAAITLPESVTSLSAYAFGDCFALTNVYVPQGTGAIYKTAFANSDNVVLNVAEGTFAHEFAEANDVGYQVRDFVYTAVASGSLSDTVQWARYENGELWITGSGAMPNFANHNGQPWYTTNNLIKKVVIGKDITAVGNYAFAYNQQITEVVFEEGSQLQSVGVLSFFNNPKLADVTLPETVTSISAYAFGDCFVLEDVYVPQGTTSIYKTAFANSDNVVLNVAEGTYAHEFAEANEVNCEVRDFVYTAVASGNLSDTVQWARYENGELWITGSGDMPNFTNHHGQPWYTTNHLVKKVVIGKDITSVGNYAFAYNQQIAAVEFEEGSQLSRVGILSFCNVASLKEITLPDTATSVSAYAFGDCYALETVVIPASVTWIPSTAFNNSSNVKLIVEKESFAHQFAINYNIAYEVK